MTAAEYHATITQAYSDLTCAPYANSTARAEEEAADARRRIRNAWITSAEPLPGMHVEWNEDGKAWRPVK